MTRCIITKKKPVEDFIREHTHINYCEAIIHKDGGIEYVKPSHVETLLRATGEDRDTVYNKMEIWDSPIHWLTKYTGCVSVWANGYMIPGSMTEEQAEALMKLITSGLVANTRFN